MPWFVRTREAGVYWWHNERHQNWADDIRDATAFTHEDAAKAVAERLCHSAQVRQGRGYRLHDDPHVVWRSINP
jgi:hypothetical protein